MTTKAKEAIDLSETLYDASSGQSIPLTLRQGGKTFDVRHQLDPLTDDRYFTYIERQDAADKTAAKNAALSTAVHSPKVDLWNELATGVEGYKARDDFRDSVHFTHKKEAIDGLLEVQFSDDELETASDAWDIDALVTVPFRAMYSGALIVNLSHSFRPETKAEMDAFLALEFSRPDKNKLASAKRESTSQRLAELGRQLLKDTTGYKPGTEVPA